MQLFTGLEYLYIDIANQYGLDKETWNKRIKWVKDNVDKLETYTKEADKKILYAKAVRALRKHEIGEGINHPVGLDSTCSCLQILGVLTKCEDTCKAVNVINSGNREDVYTVVQKYMNSTFNLNTDRDLIKYSLMPYFYGSKQAPKQAFRNPAHLQAFYNTIKSRFTGAYNAKESLIHAWNTSVKGYMWTMPDGYVVRVPVIGKRMKSIKITENVSFNMMVNIPSTMPKGVSLAANLIQSVDAYIVREMIRKSIEDGYDLYTIHDSFYTHPNYLNEVRQSYKDILIDLAKSTFLKDWLLSMGSDFTYPENSENFHLKLQDMEYHLS